MDAGSAGGTLEVAAAGGEAAPRLASMVRLRPVVLILQASGCDDELVEIDRTSCTSLHVLRLRAADALSRHIALETIASDKGSRRSGSRSGGEAAAALAAASPIAHRDIILRALDRAPTTHHRDMSSTYVLSDPAQGTVETLAVALQASALQVTSKADTALDLDID